jgi:hypothetical protein
MLGHLWVGVDFWVVDLVLAATVTAEAVVAAAPAWVVLTTAGRAAFAAWWEFAADARLTAPADTATVRTPVRTTRRAGVNTRERRTSPPFGVSLLSIITSSHLVVPTVLRLKLCEHHF